MFAILVQDLVKSYGARRAVDGLSFAVEAGELFALLGPNGAGKTTTIEILEGYRGPDSGTVRVLGCDPLRDSRVLKPRIGLMLQQGGIYPAARPLEVLRLFARFFADPLDPAELLRSVGLEESVGTPYRRLSGGQKQRLSLALALVGRPELVFLDEPTAGMDPQARQATWELIRDLRARGVTILLTTHYMDEAERLADRIAIIDHGRLVALDTPAELTAGSGDGVTRLTFRTEPGLDCVALGQLLWSEVVETAPGSYAALSAPSPAQVADLAAWLRDRDLLLTELRLGNRDLEEVFLALTGRELEA